MTAIVDLDTGQVLGLVDGRDSEGVGDWLFARPLQWRVGVQVAAIDPSAAFRKALRTWLPRTAASVDAFHLVKRGNDTLTEVRHDSRSRFMAGGGHSIDPVWANRRLLLRAGDTLSDRARDRLSTVFATDDATGKLQAAWLVKEQLRTLLTTGSLADAAAAKDRLQVLVDRAAQPETNGSGARRAGGGKRSNCSLSPGRQWRKWKPTTPLKHIKRTGRGFTNTRNYKTRILLRSAARTTV